MKKLIQLFTKPFSNNSSFKKNETNGNKPEKKEWNYLLNLTSL